MGTLGAIIGIRENRIIFLDHDGWVSSLEMEQGNHLLGYQRHFFLPFDWLSTNSHLLLKINSMGDVLFARRDELAVITRGLECAETVAFQAAVG